MIFTAHTQEHKKRTYTRPVSVLSACSLGDAKKLMRKALPAVERAEHAQFAEMFANAAREARTEWGVVFDAAVVSTFGRTSNFHDYKVSGIGREEFPEATKARLRELAQNVTKFSHMAMTHFMCAGKSEAQAIAATKALRDGAAH